MATKFETEWAITWNVYCTRCLQDPYI